MRFIRSSVSVPVAGVVVVVVLIGPISGPGPPMRSINWFVSVSTLVSPAVPGTPNISSVSVVVTSPGIFSAPIVSSVGLF